MDPPWLWFAQYSGKFSGRKGLCMRLVLDRGVPLEERHKVALGSLTDWDAARVFLEVVRCGSFRSAAERLELSINVVRRRIDDFERQIGATLPAIPSPIRSRAKSGSPSPKAWEHFGWPLALSNSSNRSRTLWSICIVRCAPPTSRGMRPTLRSICRGRPRLMSNSSGSAGYI